MIFFFLLFITAPSYAADPVGDFSKHALAEWHVKSETFPASVSTLNRMVADLPASVRLARRVTGLDYVMNPVDTGEYELTTPRGLTVRVIPVLRSAGVDTGVFEAVGYGTFRRESTLFRGAFALRVTYARAGPAASVGAISVYLDVPNRFFRLFALLARGLIQSRLDEDLARMFRESKDVMSAAESALSRGQAF